MVAWSHVPPASLRGPSPHETCKSKSKGKAQMAKVKAKRTASASCDCIPGHSGVAWPAVRPEGCHMKIPSNEYAGTSRMRAVLVFGMHQIIALLIWFPAAAMALNIVAGWANIFGWRITQHETGNLLTGSPYFPVQIVFGLFLGWSLGAWLQHGSMQWVWVIPSMVLCYFVIAFPWNGPIVFKDYAYLSSSSPLSHFFGWGCRPELRCLDQLDITLPFYCAAAYSMGAYVARVKRGALSAYAETMNHIRMPRGLLVGSAAVCIDLITQRRLIAALIHRWGWFGAIGILWTFLFEIIFVTYLFLVLISLVGNRWLLIRWFLNPERTDETGELAQVPSHP
jgi:hypothetical protein